MKDFHYGIYGRYLAPAAETGLSLIHGVLAHIARQGFMQVIQKDPVIQSAFKSMPYALPAVQLLVYGSLLSFFKKCTLNLNMAIIAKLCAQDQLKESLERLKKIPSNDFFSQFGLSWDVAAQSLKFVGNFLPVGFAAVASTVQKVCEKQATKTQVAPAIASSSPANTPSTIPDLARLSLNEKLYILYQEKQNNYHLEEKISGVCHELLLFVGKAYLANHLANYVLPLGSNASQALSQILSRRSLQ